MKIGEIIKIFRIVNQVTTCQLAEKVEVTQTFITKIEKGRKQVPPRLLEKIAEAFDIEEDVIIKISRDSEKNSWSFQKTLFEVLKAYGVK